MNWQTLVGIVVVMFGTLLMAWGSTKDSKRVESKLDEFRQEVATAKQENPAAVQALDSIGAEFENWAEDFIRDSARRRLDIEAERLQRAGEDIQLSQRVRPAFQSFLQTLRGSLAAYAKRGTRYESDLPPLPEKLFGPSIDKWRGTVTFSSEVAWSLRLSGSARDNAPSLVIGIAPADSLLLALVALSIFYYPESEEFRVVWSDDPQGFRTLDRLSPVVKLEGGVSGMQKFALDLLEVQLLHLPPPPTQ